MKLAVITPPTYTRLWDGSYHLILGQELVKDLWYRNYYRVKHDRGDYIIVDNGAAEPEDERAPFDLIVEASNEIYADEIVMPDVMYDSEATLSLTLQPEILSMVPAKYRMVVPQGSSIDEWISCFKEMSRRIGFKSLGIAKHLEQSAAGGRPAILRWLCNNSFTDMYDIHLLGIWRRPFAEIEEAKQAYKWIRGIDTGAPIAYAQHGNTLNDSAHCSLDWLAYATPALVQENIGLLKEACK